MPLAGTAEPMHRRYSPDPETGCWVYQRSINNRGYGFYRIPGTRRNASAHRYFYEEARGAIPPGMELDHLCRNTACVNPEHLEVVTPAENMRRTREPYCKRGHAMVPGNLYQRTNPRGTITHECHQCRRDRDRGRGTRPRARVSV